MRLRSACARWAAVLLTFWTALAPCAQGAEPQETQVRISGDASSRSWVLAPTAAGQVILRGDANFDSAGVARLNMLYPAAGLGGLIAAILTHGALTESAKTSQKNKLQEDADRVALPYRNALEGFDQRELMQRGAAKSRALKAPGAAPTAQSPADWVIASTPVFVITRDEDAIVLYNAVAVHAPASAAAPPVYQGLIRVVSSPRDKEGADDFWFAGQGQKLKDAAVLLVGESLDIAVGEVERGKAGTALPEKTFRYREGHAEKIERAQMVAERCDRILVRTLRGDLLSFPSSSNGCPQAAQDAAQEPPSR